jgi:hypothetical protein
MAKHTKTTAYLDDIQDLKVVAGSDTNIHVEFDFNSESAANDLLDAVLRFHIISKHKDAILALFKDGEALKRLTAEHLLRADDREAS